MVNSNLFSLMQWMELFFSLLFICPPKDTDQSLCLCYDESCAIYSSLSIVLAKGNQYISTALKVKSGFVLC